VSPNGGAEVARPPGDSARYKLAREIPTAAAIRRAGISPRWYNSLDDECAGGSPVGLVGDVVGQPGAEDAAGGGVRENG